MWLIVRHGTTTANENKRFSGQTDVPLTKEGVEETHQAVESLLEKLENCSRSEVIIFSSPLQRARIMAEELHKRTSWRFIIIDQLQEVNLGNFEGLTMEEIQGRYPQELEQWMKDHRRFTFPEGESYQDFEKRVKEALSTINEEVEKANEKPSVKIVISHGGVSEVLIREIQGQDDSEEMLKNAEIREIRESGKAD